MWWRVCRGLHQCIYYLSGTNWESKHTSNTYYIGCEPKSKGLTSWEWLATLYGICKTSLSDDVESRQRRLQKALSDWTAAVTISMQVIFYCSVSSHRVPPSWQNWEALGSRFSVGLSFWGHRRDQKYLFCRLVPPSFLVHHTSVCIIRWSCAGIIWQNSVILLCVAWPFILMWWTVRNKSNKQTVWLNVSPRSLVRRFILAAQYSSTTFRVPARHFPSGVNQRPLSDWRTISQYSILKVSVKLISLLFTYDMDSQGPSPFIQKVAQP